MAAASVPVWSGGGQGLRVPVWLVVTLGPRASLTECGGCERTAALGPAAPEGLTSLSGLVQVLCPCPWSQHVDRAGLRTPILLARSPGPRAALQAPMPRAFAGSDSPRQPRCLHASLTVPGAAGPRVTGCVVMGLFLRSPMVLLPERTARFLNMGLPRAETVRLSSPTAGATATSCSPFRRQCGTMRRSPGNGDSHRPPESLLGIWPVDVICCKHKTLHMRGCHQSQVW